ncbi:MAG TPA: hypothetical protein VMJ93_08735 [Verrucomicrobiae bacterium]|nr:hypothetical protein [Verrucomicrobiae bacterium]
MGERPSLGWSALAKSEFSRSPWDKWKRAGFVAIGAIVLAFVFYHVTKEVQSSTASATSPDSHLHYDPNAP